MPMRSLRLVSVLLTFTLTTGCVPSLLAGTGAQSLGATTATFATASAGVADTALALMILVAGVAAVGDALENGVAGGPNDEAAAARLRSAAIHAADPWVGWPSP